MKLKSCQMYSTVELTSCMYKPKFSGHNSAGHSSVFVGGSTAQSTSQETLTKLSKTQDLAETEATQHDLQPNVRADGAVVPPTDRVIKPTDRDPLHGLTSPVYSLSTEGYGDGRATMNLITYCSPMSMEPRYLALGLFRDTMTLHNFMGHGKGALQVWPGQFPFPF
jgi:hypothetical protein